MPQWAFFMAQLAIMNGSRLMYTTDRPLPWSSQTRYKTALERAVVRLTRGESVHLENKPVSAMWKIHVAAETSLCCHMGRLAKLVYETLAKRIWGTGPLVSSDGHCRSSGTWSRFGLIWRVNEAFCSILAET